ncbi:hypothetical protein JYU11_03725, partial [bacterium AH-315-G05]|nr:hypothetical protein [bacterium AH-315-G05]
MKNNIKKSAYTSLTVQTFTQPFCAINYSIVLWIYISGETPQGIRRIFDNLVPRQVKLSVFFAKLILCVFCISQCYTPVIFT